MAEGITEPSGTLFQGQETELFEELRGSTEMAAKVGMYEEQTCKAEKADKGH